MGRARLLACLAATPLAACGKGGGSDAGSVPLPPGPHLQLAIDAPRTTHYEMLCDVRTYRTGVDQYANRYGVVKTGPFRDVIPSPNAHCTAKIDSGPAPIRVSLAKDGATHSMTIEAVGDAGKKTLHVW